MAKEITLDTKLKYSSLISDKEYSYEDLQDEISRLEYEKFIAKSLDTSKKVYNNSIYGVLGYVNFIAYNKDMAETVTSISRDLIKFTIKFFDKYFREYWHKLGSEHKKMGGIITSQADYDVTNYCDTDSVMIVLRKIYELTNWKELYKEGKIKPDENISKNYAMVYDFDHTDKIKSKIDFYLRLHHYALIPYIDKMMGVYLNHYGAFLQRPNGQNSYFLGLEQINERMFWTGKKHYIKDPIWDEKQFFNPGENVSATGLEMGQKIYPEKCRNKMQEFADYLMEKDGVFSTYELIEWNKTFQQEFELLGLDDVVKTSRLNKYSEYVIRDNTVIELAPRTPEHIKAAGYYNYMLYNSEHKHKYQRIKTGDRISFYHTNDPEVPIFGYPPGIFPYEFAPELNKNKQFNKTFLDPINNLITKCKNEEDFPLPRLNSDLIIMPSF
jgi:DNA polymerase family B